MILLKTNMEAGHGGASGRFDALKEVALDFAYTLKIAGRTNAVPVPSSNRKDDAPAHETSRAALDVEGVACAAPVGTPPRMEASCTERIVALRPAPAHETSKAA